MCHRGVLRGGGWGGVALSPVRPLRRQAGRGVELAASAQQSETSVGVVDWMTQKGMPPAAVQVNSEGLVTALASVSPGDNLFVIPEKLSITSYDVAAHDLVAEVAEGRDDYVGLALWVLAERARGASSEWASFMASLPERINTPILWDPAQRDELLQGSPSLPVAVQRAAAIDEEYAGMQEALIAAMSSFPAESYSLQAFRDAFSVVLATVVYLPSVNVLALVPLAGSVRQVGSAGALLDFDQEAGAVVLKADKYYVEGDAVRVCDNMSRPNGELLLSCGLVDDENEADCLEWEASLIKADALYAAKLDILNAVGLEEDQVFPIYKDRMPNQLLAFMRMSRIQDPIELTKVNFEADQLVSQMNEYETLMLMMSDLRDRIDLYKGNIEEEIKILQDQTLTEQERVASKLRMSEKRVLQECMNGVRRRLAPIRGIPTKSGRMEDPNADLMEIFDVIDSIPNAPKKAVEGFLNWAKGKDDPDWKK